MLTIMESFIFAVIAKKAKHTKKGMISSIAIASTMDCPRKTSMVCNALKKEKRLSRSPSGLETDQAKLTYNAFWQDNSNFCILWLSNDGNCSIA